MTTHTHRLIYKLVSSYNLAEFNKMINGMIANDWTFEGGAQVVTFYIQGRGQRFLYHQTMYKWEVIEEEE